MAQSPAKLVTIPESDEIKKLRKAFDKVLSTDEGQLVWGYLHERLGWVRPIIRISRTTGDLAPLSTEAAAALRDTYLEMRRIPKRELVAAAEERAETPPVKAVEEKSKEK